VVWTRSDVSRFGLLTDPLGMTGYVLVRYANLLACHSIRFSRFRLRRIPCISCGFVRRLPPHSRSAARKYITHSHLACQQAPGTFSRNSVIRPYDHESEAKRKPPGRTRKASQRRVAAMCDNNDAMDSSPSGTRFSTRAPVSWIQLAVR
jgi:hypothetical protein